MPERFEVERAGARRLILRGELDIAAADSLSEAIRDAHDADGPIAIDLRGVTFIDSTGLRALLGSARELEGRGALVLEHPSPRVVEVLEIAGIIGTAPNLVLKRNER